MSSNPIYVFFATPKSFGPFILRLLLAAVFIFHGGQKTFGWFDGPGWTASLKMFAGMGFSPGVAVAVMFVELLVAISMLFGFLTRLSALGVIGVMAGALYFVHAPQGWAASEFPFALLMAALALVFLGGGRLSLDRGISRQLLPTLGGY